MTSTGRTSVMGGSNAGLRAVLDEAGMSNAALARAVVTVGAEEGVHIGTNATSVKRMLDGSSRAGQYRDWSPRCSPRTFTVRSASLSAGLSTRLRRSMIGMTGCAVPAPWTARLGRSSSCRDGT